jgi:16S rRNA (guanine527-N7)-methyltransferase
MSADVVEALEEAQQLGFLGPRPVPEVVEHAREFVTALDGLDGVVVDLGSGGGVPGLVIAHDRPDLDVVMVDRRSKRTDFLMRVVLRLRWSDRIRVITDDVVQLIRRSSGGFDAAVARGFGPPDVTLRVAARLVRPGGRVVISDPPSGDRWDPDLLSELGVCRIDEARSSMAVFQRDGFT